jgi:iron complex outermembrane recepter protein
VRMAPAVGTFRRSSSAIADPTSQGLNLRGVGPSGVSRALMLRDGIPVNDPFGGWIYWRAVSPLAIERIEIAPSGASALFGNFALGGVLQVVSRPIEDREIDAVLAGGTLGSRRAAARATERFGEFGVELNAEGLTSDGYAPIRAEQRGTIDGPANSSHGVAGARIEHRRGGSTAQLGVRGFLESLDAGTQHTTADVRTLTYDAGWALDGEGGRFHLQLFGGMQRFDQERARITLDRSQAVTASNQRTPSNNQGMVATWTTRAGSHTIITGVDAQRVAGTSTDSLSPPMVNPDTIIRRSAGGEQRFAGLFAQDAFQLTSDLELAAAVRLDGWQNLDGQRTITRSGGSMETARLSEASEIQLDPRIGALYRISPELAARASVYRAFRAPTLNELYRPFQVGTVLTAANDRLEPETLWGGELGTQIDVQGLSVQATGFWNRLSDPITNVTLAQPVDGAARQRQNLGASRVLGLELGATWRPDPSWTLRLGHAFSDATVTAAPAQPDLVGKRLAQDPRHRMTAGLSFANERIVTVAAQARYLGRQFEDDLNTLRIGSVVLFDIHAQRRLWRELSWFVSGQNLFDRRYLVGRAGIDTEGAPRTFEIGLAYHLGAAPK